MQTGIIGLPQVGKTTLFKILTRAQLDEKAARAATHVGVARVPDARRVEALIEGLSHGEPEVVKASMLALGDTIDPQEQPWFR